MEKVLAISELKDELIKDAVKKAIDVMKTAKDNDICTILLAKGKNNYPILLQMAKEPISGIYAWVNPEFPINKQVLVAVKRASIECRVAKAFEDTGLAERARKDTAMGDQLQQCLIQISKDLCGSI